MMSHFGSGMLLLDEMKSEKTSFRKWPVHVRKFGSVYAVWFRKSKTFLLLQHPARRVLQLLTEGFDAAAIDEICNIEFSQIEVDASRFASELIQLFSRLNRYKKNSRLSKIKEGKNIPAPENFSYTKYYRFGTNVICFDFDSQWLQHLVHPSFLHYACDKQPENAHHISCFGNKGLLLLNYNNNPVEAFGESDIEYYKGAVSQLLYSILYKKRFQHWMCTLHASGVFAKNKAIIFSAAAGSGKSTVSAILHAHAHGFQLVSDDFIAATADGKVYPFPAAMTVKEGAIPVLSKLYPELKEQQPEKASTGKMVRYLPVYNYDSKLKNGIGVAAFVFVKYEAGSGFNFSAIEKKDALQLLLQETWVNPKANLVDAFFNWVEATPFYRMTYNNNEEMIAMVKNLLES